MNPPAVLFALPAAGAGAAGGGGGGGPPPPGGPAGRRVRRQVPPEIRALHERRFRLEDLHDVIKGDTDDEIAEREMRLHFMTLLYPLQHAYPVGDESVRLKYSCSAVVTVPSSATCVSNDAPRGFRAGAPRARPRPRLDFLVSYTNNVRVDLPCAFLFLPVFARCIAPVVLHTEALFGCKAITSGCRCRQKIFEQRMGCQIL